MKKIILLLIFVSSISLFAKNILLGVVPQQSPLKLANKWLKITKYLEKETGFNIIFSTEKSIPEFEKSLYIGLYDVSYMNPYHFIIANKRQKYEAFVRAQKDIVGIIVSKDKKLDLTNIKSLKNKKFLFPAPNAFAATLLPKYEFKNIYNFDIDKNAKALYVNSHDSVYKGISRGLGYLGGGIIRTYNNFLEDIDKKNLHIVYKTKAYPSHPFAYHPRMSKDDIAKIEKAIINMPSELKKILSIKKFKKIDSNEYEVIKNLNVK